VTRKQRAEQQRRESESQLKVVEAPAPEPEPVVHAPVAIVIPHPEGGYALLSGHASIVETHGELVRIEIAGARIGPRGMLYVVEAQQRSALKAALVWLKTHGIPFGSTRKMDADTAERLEARKLRRLARTGGAA
jgi:hypothetical protein